MDSVFFPFSIFMETLSDPFLLHAGLCFLVVGLGYLHRTAARPVLFSYPRGLFCVLCADICRIHCGRVRRRDGRVPRSSASV